jgi:outer membrane immunogenic protein
MMGNTMNKAKWIALAAVVLVAPVTGAQAQTAAFSWTGFYIGANAGYAMGDGSVADLFCDGVTPGNCPDGPGGPPGTYIATLDSGDFAGGGHVGGNYQFDGGFVLGVEADLGTGGSYESNFIFGENLGYTGPNPDATGQIDLGLTGSARLRAGMAMERFLPYVTAGVAFAAMEASIADTSNPAANRAAEGNFLGYTVGGGADYAVTDNLIIGAEYRFSDYGALNLGLTQDVPFDAWAHRAELQTHDLRVKASFKF